VWQLHCSTTVQTCLGSEATPWTPGGKLVDTDPPKGRIDHTVEIGTSSTGGGHTAERAELSEITFHKVADLASPILAQTCAAGNTIGKAKFAFLRAWSFLFGQHFNSFLKRADLRAH
jgi:hypothetical protein